MKSGDSVGLRARGPFLCLTQPDRSAVGAVAATGTEAVSLWPPEHSEGVQGGS